MANIAALTITVNTSGVGQATAQLNQLSTASKQAATTSAQLQTFWDGQAKALGKMALTYAGVVAAVHGFVGALKAGLKAADDYNRTIINIAATLTDISKIPEGGTFKNAYESNYRYAKNMYDKINIEAAKHFSTGQELIQAWTILTQKGLKLREEEIPLMAQIVDKIRLATQGQASHIQIAQELRSIMSGQAKQADQIALLLRDRYGGAWRDIVDQQRKAGTLLPWLANETKGLGFATQDIVNTMEAQVNTLKTHLSIIGRDGLMGLYRDIVKLLQAINAEASNHAKWAEIIYDIYIEMKSAIIDFGKVLSVIPESFAAMKGVIDFALLEPIQGAWNVLKQIAEEIDRLTGVTKERGPGLTGLAEGAEWGLGKLFSDLTQGVPSQFFKNLKFDFSTKGMKSTKSVLQEQAFQKKLEDIWSGDTGEYKTGTGTFTKEQQEAVAATSRAIREMLNWNKQAAAESGNEWMKLIALTEQWDQRIADILQKMSDIPEIQQLMVYWEEKLVAARDKNVRLMSQSIQRDYQKWVAQNTPGIEGARMKTQFEIEDVMKKFFSRPEVFGSAEQAATYTPKGMVDMSAAVGESVAKLPPKMRELEMAVPGLTQVILEASQAFGVSENLIRAFIRSESTFNPRATSPKGAMGLMQIMPDTVDTIRNTWATNRPGMLNRFPQGTNPYDIAYNVMMGTSYLADRQKQYGGNLQLTAMGYNAGPGRKDDDQNLRFDKWISNPESQRYLTEIMGTLGMLGGGAAGEGAVRAGMSGMDFGAFKRIEAQKKYQDENKYLMDQLNRWKEIYGLLEQGNISEEKRVQLQLQALQIEKQMADEKMRLAEVMGGEEVTLARQTYEIEKQALHSKELKLIQEAKTVAINEEITQQSAILDYVGKIANLTKDDLDTTLEYRTKQLELEQKIAKLTLERQLTENKMLAPIGDQLRALQAQTQELERQALVREKWQGQGVFGGVKSWAYERGVESRTRDFNAVKDVFAGAENLMADSIGKGIVGALTGKKADFKKVGETIVEGLIDAMVKYNVGKLFDMIGGGIRGASKGGTKGGGFLSGLVGGTSGVSQEGGEIGSRFSATSSATDKLIKNLEEPMTEWENTAKDVKQLAGADVYAYSREGTDYSAQGIIESGLQMAGANAEASSLLSASGMAGIAAGASVLLGGLALATGSQELMYAAMALQIVATLLQIAATMDTIPFLHHGGTAHRGTMIRAHSGIQADERAMVLQTGEGVLSRSAMAKLGDAGFSSLNAGLGIPSGNSGVSIQVNPTINVKQKMTGPEVDNWVRGTVIPSINKELGRHLKGRKND